MLVLHQEILVVQDWVELALGLHTFHELLYQIENLLRNLKTVAVRLIRKVTIGREHRQEILHIQLRKLSAYNQESLEK
jgi:DNA gyrase/topoisomerase IV subunit A